MASLGLRYSLALRVNHGDKAVVSAKNGHTHYLQCWNPDGMFTGCFVDVSQRLQRQRKPQSQLPWPCSEASPAFCSLPQAS
ncbi:hypothetical protein ALQ08_200189 [Pseudomonas syringae pv. delphinii]|uniref:Uncharacterized protein n=1 Tax=Pseudomonas syringae pv. delphinii TaxID=192088 RepID=A0A3M4KHI1_9PSED|nr:hypothetical protein ALQ08_200189 [Pseudomonas syringae pv. delphinii]